MLVCYLAGPMPWGRIVYVHALQGIDLCWSGEGTAIFSRVVDVHGYRRCLGCRLVTLCSGSM